MSKIIFNFNKEKAIEVILYLIKKKPSMDIDKMSLFKFLFFSDEEHLNKYGRPITGGHYVAMQYGPVHSQISNLVKHTRKDSFNVLEYMITAQREPNMDYISESDKEVMDEIFEKYKNYNALELSEISHKHPAWLKAKQRNLIKNNNALDYKDMINPQNTELIEDLEENSRYIVI